MVTMRALAEVALAFRARLANVAGKTFDGKRDAYKIFGYKRELFPTDYRSRYRRNAVANRIVKALPNATWRGGADIVEDEDPDTVTPFEQAVIDLDKRLKIWDKVKRADVLAGIGRYAVLLMVAPGEVDTPLVSCPPDGLVQLVPYAEEDATVERWDADKNSPRFGHPVFYSIKRTEISETSVNTAGNVGKRVHWTRILHISDGLLDDNVYGEPRLECVWNLLDDLEKLSGGGSEAFAKRADQGVQFDLDPEAKLSDEAKAALKQQIEEYEHELRRTMFTRGIEAKTLGSDVADFKSPIEAIMSLISAGTGIPQRVLMGSEQGKLAAKQDRANWDNRVQDRQKDFAEPCIVRPLIDRFIELGVLPKPGGAVETDVETEERDDEPETKVAGDYEVHFSSLTTMDDEQRADMAAKWKALNSGGETVVTVNEIRTLCLDLEPIEDVLTPEELTMRQEAIAAKHEQTVNPPPPMGRFNKKGGRDWKHVHQAADRFRRAGKAGRLSLLRRRQTGHGSGSPAEGAGAARRAGRADAGERGHRSDGGVA